MVEWGVKKSRPYGGRLPTVLLTRNGGGNRASGRVKNSDAITTPGQKSKPPAAIRQLTNLTRQEVKSLTGLNLLMIFLCM
jgi:hypothetical protein